MVPGDEPATVPEPGAGLGWVGTATGLLVALAGSSGFLVVPMVVSALRYAGVPENWTGLIGSADPAGMFVGAAAALLPAVRRSPRRAALIALALALGCNAASLLFAHPAILLMIRLACGFGGGLALAIGVSVLARTRLPDRSFALLALSQMMFGALVAGIGDAGRSGLGVIYLCAFGVQIVGITAALLLAGRADGSSGARNRKLDKRTIGLTALGNFMSAAGFLTVWANIQMMATTAGVPASASVAVFDCGLAGGFTGGIVAVLIDGSTRRGLVTFVLFAIGLASILAIGFSSSLVVFLAATFLFQFSTATAFFGFGIASEIDPGGKLPIIFMLSVKAGFGLAPLIASQILLHMGRPAVLLASFVATVLAMAAYQGLIRHARHATAG